MQMHHFDIPEASKGYQEALKALNACKSLGSNPVPRSLSRRHWQPGQRSCRGLLCSGFNLCSTVRTLQCKAEMLNQRSDAKQTRGAPDETFAQSGHPSRIVAATGSYLDAQCRHVKVFLAQAAQRPTVWHDRSGALSRTTDNSSGKGSGFTMQASGIGWLPDRVLWDVGVLASSRVDLSGISSGTLESLQVPGYT